MRDAGRGEVCGPGRRPSFRACILARDPDRDRIDVGREHRAPQHFAIAMASTPEPVPRSRMRAKRRARISRSSDGKHAGGGRMVAGAEGLAGVDLDRDPARRDASAVVAAVHEEAAGDDRRQASSARLRPSPSRAALSTLSGAPKASVPSPSRSVAAIAVRRRPPRNTRRPTRARRRARRARRRRRPRRSRARGSSRCAAPRGRRRRAWLSGSCAPLTVSCGTSIRFGRRAFIHRPDATGGIMAKRIAVIQGHPDPSPERLCRALAGAYRRGAEEAGHEVRTIDVTDSASILSALRRSGRQARRPPTSEKRRSTFAGRNISSSSILCGSARCRRF